MQARNKRRWWQLLNCLRHNGSRTWTVWDGKALGFKKMKSVKLRNHHFLGHGRPFWATYSRISGCPHPLNHFQSCCLISTPNENLSSVSQDSSRQREAGAAAAGGEKWWRTVGRTEGQHHRLNYFRHRKRGRRRRNHCCPWRRRRQRFCVRWPWSRHAWVIVGFGTHVPERILA